ncbi:MAG: hypothetical protein MI861_11995, partial [Pirellulales bacterium]|nr:hypothetical protein [Pirellulales bacterium]
MNDPARLWADPRLVYTVAAAAVALLLITLWLFGRRRRQGRQAAVICLILSISLHLALIFLVPLLPSPDGGAALGEPVADQQPGTDQVQFSTFDPDMTMAEAAGEDVQTPLTPLPVANLTDPLEAPIPLETPLEPATDQSETTETASESIAQDAVPETLAASAASLPGELLSHVDAQLSDLLAEAAEADLPAKVENAVPNEPSEAVDVAATAVVPPAPTPAVPTSATPPAPAPRATVAGSLTNDFANRVGQAKEIALQQTGGNVRTEAAVEAALRFLAQAQRD